MSECVCSCGGGYQEIRPRHIPCDRLLAGSWSSIPLIHPPGIGGGGVAGGSSFASKWGQPSQEKLAKFIRARSWAYSDSLPYIFDKEKNKVGKICQSAVGKRSLDGILLQFPGSKSAFREQPQQCLKLQIVGGKSWEKRRVMERVANCGHVCRPQPVESPKPLWSIVLICSVTTFSYLPFSSKH